MPSRGEYDGIGTTDEVAAVSQAARASNVVGDGDWLHVPGSARRPNSSNSLEATEADIGEDVKDNTSLKVTNISNDEEGDGDDDRMLASDEEYEYEDDDYELTSLADNAIPPPTSAYGNPFNPCTWRPKERFRCFTILALSLVFASFLAYQSDQDSSFSTLLGRLNGGQGRHPPPGAVGVGHASYDTLHSSHVDELDARLTLYRHRATGAEFLAFVPDILQNGPGSSGGNLRSSGDDDGVYDPKPDKVFGVAFRTKPESSTGVPHILEHSVLCGSQKYPSRDPFAYLLKGSLQTFLNAMTYPDRTVYPVASRNRADFRNLMDVYLDAVFHPRAVEDEGWWVLRQEGWRYDVADSDDNPNKNDDDDGNEGEWTATSPGERVPFVYKGVVYSEMKGAYSDPEDYMDRVTQSLLFPDNAYFYDSGGDPAVIPTLTREEFVAFYKKYYHPTNARLFVAGDESDVYHALSAADHYMTPMGYNPESRKDSVIAYQQRKFSTPVSQRKPFAVAPSDDDSGSSEGFMLCITWLLNTQPLSPMMELAWIVLDELLLGKSTSPLDKILRDSGLGEELVGGGLDNELLQSTFAVGMRGIKNREDVGTLEELILNTLHDLDSNGFSDDDIASSLNTIEFSLREGGGGLRGMEVFLGALTKWNYDLSPKDALVYEDALKQLKDEIKRTGSNTFQQMIRDFLLTNNHRVVLELYPSTTLEAEKLQDEKIQAKRAQSKMNDKEYENVIEEGKKLKKLQAEEESPEVIASNPRLSISDIDKSSIEYPIEVEEDAFGSGIRLITHEVTSSGIAYVNFGMDVSMIPYEDIELFPALITLMNEAGTSDMSEIEFRNYVGKVSGGVDTSLQIISVKPTGWDDESKVLPGVNMLSMLFVGGKCTSDKISDLFDIFQKVLEDINFDDSHDIVRNALKSKLSSTKSSIASRGHSFVNTRIRGRYSVRNYVDEKLYGVSRLSDLAALLDSVETDWPGFVQRLTNMRKAILNANRDGMLLDITGDRVVLDGAMESAKQFLIDRLPLDVGNKPPPSPNFRSVPHPWIEAARNDMNANDSVQDEGIVVSTQVAYVGQGGRIYDVGEKVSGSTSVVSHYLTTGYMWDTIRAKMGAYGAYSSFSSSDGVVTLYTYRDPNSPDDTLKAFDDAADDILKATSTSLIQDNNAAITTAVIGTIGSLDGSAKSAESAGWTALVRWLRGESAKSRQRWREEVLNTKVDDFTDFAKRLNSWRESSIAIVASQSAFDDLSSKGMKLSLVKAQRI